MNEWKALHNRYKKQDWKDRPSLFAETALPYFSKQGTVLELGAGLGQDGRYFAEHGLDVISTDLEIENIVAMRETLPHKIQQHYCVQHIDLREPLPFGDASLEGVYAHLSLHYFDKETTERIFDEIYRVLQSGGVFAFFVNSTSDPEYNTGKKLEDDYFFIDDKPKRFFTVESAKAFAHRFTPELIDNNGETYKDQDKGVHNLIRFIGKK